MVCFEVSVLVRMSTLACYIELSMCNSNMLWNGVWMIAGGRWRMRHALIMFLILVINWRFPGFSKSEFWMFWIPSHLVNIAHPLVELKLGRVPLASCTWGWKGMLFSQWRSRPYCCQWNSAAYLKVSRHTWGCPLFTQRVENLVLLEEIVLKKMCSQYSPL